MREARTPRDLSTPDSRCPYTLTIRYQGNTEVTRFARLDEGFAAVQGLAAYKGWVLEGDENMGVLGETYEPFTNGVLVRAFYEIEKDGDR